MRDEQSHISAFDIRLWYKIQFLLWLYSYTDNVSHACAILILDLVKVCVLTKFSFVHETCLTVLIVHRIVLFWEPDRCFKDGGQENRREVGAYFITISSVY